MMQQYSDFNASELFCPKCKRAVPVRNKLLLLLPQGEKYHYTCQICGASLGEKTVSLPDKFTALIR
ncbi:MAG: cytoplasmic protein [Smithellaceae bacterium]|nr:cytoplasmic protein [Smithellaceae bacterium]